MTSHRPNHLPHPPTPSLNAAVMAATSFVLCGALCAACATAAPEAIPDATRRIAGPGATEPDNPEDVFLRKPWEIWRSPKQKFRYHKEAGMLLPDEEGPFKLNDVSIYAPDGSDVRVDYESVNLDSESQAQESITVFVARARTTLEQEWQAVRDRQQRQFPGAQPADPFPIPDRYPTEIRQTAYISAADPATFHQTTLFHQGAWSIRYEIECPAPDVPIARKKTPSFLISLRPN